MTMTDEVEVLLVEDNSRDAEMTVRELKKHGLANKLVWVKDGAEALEFIFGDEAQSGGRVARRPKVVVLDLKLPKVDGFEVLRQLKSNAASRTIPVVMLTSSREEGDIEQCYQLGANSYIVKPVNFDSFSTAVAQLGMFWLMWNEAAKSVAP